MEINAYTELFCIFGRPVRHSLSPAMHNAAFTELDMNAVYLAFEPDSSEGAISSMKSLGIRGASITIPFKIEAMSHVDKLDPLACNIGSINTLVNDGESITGFNTDGSGALRAMAARGITVDGKSVLCLGNGGSARAIAFTLLGENARVTIAGRNMGRVTPLVDDLSCHHQSVEALLIEDLTPELMDSFDIIINTTPVGMRPDIDATPIHTDLLLKRHTVFDIVYAPDTTSLLRAAYERGCNTIRGMEMLLYQGILQFELWTGREAPVETMRRTLQLNLTQRESEQ